MNAAATLKAWKNFARSNSRGGGDNVFRVGSTLYSFDAQPRELQNGALQGRFWAQAAGESPRDLGAYKISGDGSIAFVPDELVDVLPIAEPEATRPDYFRTDDVEPGPIYEGRKS